jgi:hypothetical protein
LASPAYLSLALLSHCLLKFFLLPHVRICVIKWL